MRVIVYLRVKAPNQLLFGSWEEGEEMKSSVKETNLMKLASPIMVFESYM